VTPIEFLGERTRERDRPEFELGDAFDVKASIVLVILAFLGITSAKILTAENLTGTPKLPDSRDRVDRDLRLILRCPFVAEGSFV